MLIRDGSTGVDVFMLQRSHSSAFARSHYVFPGGRVDDTDAASVYEPISDGATDVSVSAQIGVESGGLAWLVAAIRECFEEAGVLLARPSDSDDPIAFDTPERVAYFEEARHKVHDGDLGLIDLCRERNLQLLTDRLYVTDHWITPLGEVRRFDTRFFVTRAPDGQVPLEDQSETIASLWTSPRAALDRFGAGDLQMLPPTLAALRWLDQFPDADAAMKAASLIGIPDPIEPKLIVNADNQVVDIIRPGEPGYADITGPEFVVGSFAKRE